MASCSHLLSLLLLLFVVCGGAASASAASGGGGCSAETFSKNRVFATCADLPQLSSSLHWTFDEAKGELTLAFSAAASEDGWASWAINPASDKGMLGAQALLAFRQANGSMGVRTYDVTSYQGIQESPILYPTSDLAAEYAGGRIRIFGTVKLPANTATVRQVWQVGPGVTNGVPQIHALQTANYKSKGMLNLVKGEATAAGGGDSITRQKNIHGVLNAVSWGILLPIGATFSRYLKTFQSADPAWFYLHVACQIIGYGVGVGGWATGLDLGRKSEGITYTTHRNIGIALFALGTLQVFALLLRPGKEHKFRIYWNVYHHSVGYTVIILGIINVFKGLNILDPGQKWITAYIVAISILGGIALSFEVITWVIVLRRKSRGDAKAYGSGASSNGVQQPFSM